MLPSKEFNHYWIYAYSPAWLHFASDAYTGKWLIYIPIEQLDETWIKIKDAVQQMRLGPCAMVSTMRESSLAEFPNLKVICVFTKDYRDMGDVMLVREQLSKLGFIQKLRYKTDAATFNNEYGPYSFAVIA